MLTFLKMIASSRNPPSDVLDESIFCSNIITLFASKTPYETIKLVYRVSNVITKSEKLDFYLNSNLLLRNCIKYQTQPQHFKKFLYSSKRTMALLEESLTSFVCVYRVLIVSCYCKVFSLFAD